MHEYNVIGNTKKYIYYYLSILSISISSLIPIFFRFFTNVTGITISIIISSSTIFTILYFLFDKLVWKIPILGIPNISGDYECIGKSMKYNSSTEHAWNGFIHISQNMEQDTNHT